MKGIEEGDQGEGDQGDGEKKERKGWWRRERERAG